MNEFAALSNEVESVMRSIADRLMELPYVDGACLSTVEGELAHFVVGAGADAELEGRTLPLSETLGAMCVERGGLVVLRKTTGPEVDRCLTAGAAAILLAPIEWGGRMRGVLGVRSPNVDAFDDASLEGVRMLLAGAQIAFRNAEMIERLAESEKSYRDLHEQAADAAIVIDARGDVVGANEAAAALLWRPVDELRSMNWRELFTREELAASPPRIEELETRGEARAERPFLRKDGTEVMVESSCRLLSDGRYHLSLRDVTQRRRNEERLRTSLGRLHAVVQTQQEISTLELDPGTMTQALAERAQQLAGAEGAGVQWFEGDYAILHHCSGMVARRVGVRIDRGKSLSGLAALTGEIQYSPDTHSDRRVDRRAADELGARSLICAPLHLDGKVAGVLAIYSARPNAFDELAVESTRMMAEFVSSVMRNASELEARRQLIDELTTQSQVVEHMQTALWVFAEDGDKLRLDYANEACEKIIGLDRREVIGWDSSELFPSAPDELVVAVKSVLETGEPRDFGEIDYGDARIKPGIFSMKVFPLAGRRIALSVEDVTEVARSQRALQESEARFRGAFDSTSVGMALTALDATFVEVNARFADMLGYTESELMQLGVRGISHPEDVQVDIDYAKRIRDGEVDEYEREKRYLRKDGSVMWAHLTVSVVRTFDGTPAHVVSHVVDVTAQKEATMLFTSMFERSVLPTLVFDDDKLLVDVNDAAAELLGIERAAAAGLSLDELLADEPVSVIWEDLLANGHWEGETWVDAPGGHRLHAEFVATASVQPGRHLAVVRDMTKQKELEVQLRQAQKMEAVGRLAGGIAHDFNNLLTAIAGYGDFLVEGLAGDEKLRRHAVEIKKASQRAGSLTGQLLAFSRRQVLQPRVLDLNSVVSDMDMMLRRLIGEDVELVTMLDPQVAPVLADPTQVEQVIVNLAVNARDAMPHGGSVTIETTNVSIDDDAFVELRLTDTGTGMTETERQQLFDPFFTTKAGGTGLGLATVYGIVDQSGGTIEVESGPGLGSSFRILLPAAADAEVEEREQAPAHDAPEKGVETILLVEDETVVRQLVAEILESHGYSVLSAGDGPSALELLRRHGDPVELLVTDVVMPGMSGPEVAKAVTSMRPGMQVLYISGYTDSAIGHHGVLEPGIAFLQKPFSADDLVRKVRSVLDGVTAGVD